MKKLIFIDDNSDILSAQEHQMNELLKKDGNLDVEVESFSCNLSAAPDCLNDMGEIAYPDDPDYEQTNHLWHHSGGYCGKTGTGDRPAA